MKDRDSQTGLWLVQSLQGGSASVVVRMVGGGGRERERGQCTVERQSLVVVQLHGLHQAVFVEWQAQHSGGAQLARAQHARSFFCAQIHAKSCQRGRFVERLPVPGRRLSVAAEVSDMS